MILLLVLALWLQAGPAPVQLPAPSDHACYYQGSLPDPYCTPGSVDPGATLDVICVRGYSARVRPPSSYTEPLKRQQMRDYGVGGRRLSEFKEDHLVPLEIGGSPYDPANLWPEPTVEADLKDRVENASRRAVCRGELDLSFAQQLMAEDWTALGAILGVD